MPMRARVPTRQKIFIQRFSRLISFRRRAQVSGLRSPLFGYHPPEHLCEDVYLFHRRTSALFKSIVRGRIPVPQKNVCVVQEYRCRRVQVKRPGVQVKRPGIQVKRPGGPSQTSISPSQTSSNVACAPSPYVVERLPSTTRADDPPCPPPCPELNEAKRS